MSFRNADVLYAAGDDILEKYGTWVWRTLPAEEGRRNFSRSGDAWLFDRNMERYRKAESGVARAAHHVHANDGNWYRGFLLERGVTPQNDDSVRFEAANSAWAETGTGTPTSAIVSSIFDDLPTNGEAREWTTDGTANAQARIEQTVGSSTAEKECVVAVFERVGQDDNRVRVVDDTGAYIDITYNWTTDSLTEGTGTGAVEVLSKSGPNGGKVIRLIGIGTGNNTTGRTLDIFIVNQQTNTSGIIHYAHHVELAYPTSPIPYVGAPQSRPGEEFYVSPGVGPTKSAWYVKFVAGTLVGDTGIFPYIVEHGGGADPRLRVFEDDNTPGEYALFFEDANNNSASRSTDVGTPKPGQLVEIVYAADPADGNVRLLARLDEGTVQGSGSAKPGSWTTPDSFGNEEQIVYNEKGDLTASNRGAQKYLRHYGVDADAMDTDPFSGTAADVLDELAGHTV